MRENYFTWQVGDYRKMWGKKCVYQLVCLSKFFSKKMPGGLMPFSTLLASCNFSFHLYLSRKWWPFIFNFKRHILNLALSLSKNYTESAQLPLMWETLMQKLLASYSYPVIIMFVFKVQNMPNAKFTAVADRFFAISETVQVSCKIFMVIWNSEKVSLNSQQQWLISLGGKMPQS